MNFTVITRALSKAGRALKNASPEIAIIGGTVGLVVAGVFACKETPKAMKVIESHKEKIATVETTAEKGELANGEEYTPEDMQHDKAIIFAQDGLSLLKVYAFPLILGTLSVVSIFAGGKILRGRLTTVTAAYGLLEQRFSKYRDGVIEKFGSDMDKELRYKTTNTVVEEKKEDGTTEMKEIKRTAYDGYSQYARFFDESNPHWVKDGARNLAFLQMQQQYACDRLRIKGVLFLNDVYESLGIPRSPEGQLVGWVYNPDGGSADNFVDFGITEILRNKTKFYQYMRDEERSFLLDFNCDGRIIDTFTKYEKY